MSGNILEVGQPIGVARHAIAIILDREIMLAVFTTPRNCDGLGMRIDAVLDKFGNRFERVTLRESDDADRVPVIPYLELAALVSLGSFHGDLRAARRRRLSATKSISETILGVPKTTSAMIS